MGPHVRRARAPARLGRNGVRGGLGRAASAHGRDHPRRIPKAGRGSGSQPVSPPWFLAGAEVVWQRIAEAERALRGLVREVYAAAFGDRAAQKIEGTLAEPERVALSRALRTRPAGAEPLSVVDYLYLAQLPNLLFAEDVWPRVS